MYLNYNFTVRRKHSSLVGFIISLMVFTSPYPLGNKRNKAK